MINPQNMIENLVKETLLQQKEFQNEEKYNQAQKCRKLIQATKKGQFDSKNKEIHKRQEKQKQALQSRHEEEDKNLATQSQFKINKIYKHEEQQMQALQKKHKEQQQKLKQKLKKKYKDLKLKESSELLNMRKIKESLAKQQKYPQAQELQTRIKKLYEEEEKKWKAKNQEKKKHEINKLNQAHALEMTTLKKRITTVMEETMKDKQTEEKRINMKYQHLYKELKAQHERQLLSFKGELKNLGGKEGLSGCSPRKMFRDSNQFA